MFVFQLIADNRIESAAEGSVCQVVVEAGEADYIGIKETLELNNQNGIECKDTE